MQKLQKEESKARKGFHRCVKALQVFFLSMSMAPAFAMQALAAGTDMWGKAETIMKDVYGKILGISTVAGIVTASVALLLMNFSRDGKTVDSSRSWLKRIVVTWVILNSLGFIMAYVAPLFSDGKWNG